MVLSKKLFISIYVSIVSLIFISLIVLSILGIMERVGYLSDFVLDNSKNNFKEEKEIFTNEKVYRYHFKLKYYSKIFKNSDIFGVYFKSGSLPEYIKNIELDDGGSPYGFVDSAKYISKYDEISNIKYILKIRPAVKIYFLIFVILYPLLYFPLLFIKKIINPAFIFFVRTIYRFFIERFFSLFYEKKDNLDESKLNKLYYERTLHFVIKLLISFILSLYAVFISKQFGLSDLKSYVVFLLSMVFIFYLSSVLPITLILKSHNRTKKYLYVISFIFFISILLVSCHNTFLELKTWNYPTFQLGWYNVWSEQNFTLFFLELLLVFVLFSVIVVISYRITEILLSIFTVFLIAYSQYSPVVWDLFHHLAHFHSVFMVNQGTPFSENMYSIYGHYAYLMMPIFKIFGLNVVNYAVLLSVLSGLCAIFTIITMFYLIRNPFYRILSLLVLIYASFTIKLYYYAIIPLRTIFPTILMCYSILLAKNRKNIFIICGGYIISSLAVIWNPDTGLTCLFAWCALHIFDICNSLSFRDKKFYTNIIIALSFFILSLLTSLVIFNIFNLSLGGKLQGIKDLLFPMLSGFSGVLDIKIKYWMTYWTFPVVSLAFVFIYSIRNMKIFNNSVDSSYEDYSSPVLFISSLIGLGVFSYSINRMAFYNNIIGVFPSVIVCMWLLYKIHLFIISKNRVSKTYTNVLRPFFIPILLIGLFLALVFSVTNFTNLFFPLSEGTRYYFEKKNDERNSITYAITEFVKKYGYDGMPAFGGYYDYGYANLGWTNSLILPDEPDFGIRGFGYKKASEILKNHNANEFFSSHITNDVWEVDIKGENQVKKDFYNNYVKKYYTNIAEPNDNGFYLYKRKELIDDVFDYGIDR